MMSATPDGKLALDFLAVRRAVGIVGLALPIVLVLGALLLFGGRLEPSISDYHGSGMRDVFVGLLCAIGVFLFSYRGFGSEDWYAGQVAGLLAFVVAVFPNTGKTSAVHFGAAALFFVALALTSLLLFTRSSEEKESQPQGKRRRNRIYVTCGWGILGCIALIAGYTGFLKGSRGWLDALAPVFWLEAIAIWFFAVSWLVKGEALQGGLSPKKVQRFFTAGEKTR